jgi:hypothetical protein
VAWRRSGAALCSVAQRGFFYMNQLLSGGLQNFSSRETQKKMFHGNKKWLFLDTPPWVFRKKNEVVISSWNFFLI